MSSYKNKTHELKLTDAILKEVSDSNKYVRLFFLLQKIKMCFDSLKDYVDWFLDRKTLLDTVQFQSLAPWSRAIYIGLKRIDKERTVEYVCPLLEKAGLKCKVKDDSIYIYQYLKDTKEYDLCILTIYTYDEEKKIYTSNSGFYTQEEMGEVIQPCYIVNPITLDESLCLPGPSNPISYLDRNYRFWRSHVLANGKLFEIKADEENNIFL